MLQLKVGTSYKFYASHKLPHSTIPDDREPHYHEWEVKLEYTANTLVLDKNGFSLDFRWLDELLAKLFEDVKVNSSFDCLNIQVPQTAENLALWTWTQIIALSKNLVLIGNHGEARLSSVTVIKDRTSVATLTFGG